MKDQEFIKLIHDCNLEAIKNALKDTPTLCNAKSISQPLFGKKSVFSALQVATYELDKLSVEKQQARLQIVCELIGSGADITFVDSFNFNFLQSNIYMCARKTVDAAKREHEGNETTLLANAKLHYGIVKYLLNNSKTSNLTAAENNNNALSIEEFVAQSFRAILVPQRGDLEGRSVSCLNLAIWSGREELVTLILEHSKTLPLIQGVISPLHEAIIMLMHDEFTPVLNQSRYEILKKLLRKLHECGSDIEEMIDQPCEQDYQTEVNKGFAYNAIGAIMKWSKPTSYNAKGSTPLHSVIEFSQSGSTLRLSVVKLLLAYHANDTLTDSNGRTPIQLARELKYQDIEELLQQYALIRLANSSNLETLESELTSLNPTRQPSVPSEADEPAPHLQQPTIPAPQNPPPFIAPPIIPSPIVAPLSPQPPFPVPAPNSPLTVPMPSDIAPVAAPIQPPPMPQPYIHRPPQPVPRRPRQPVRQEEPQDIFQEMQNKIVALQGKMNPEIKPGTSSNWDSDDDDDNAKKQKAKLRAPIANPALFNTSSNSNSSATNSTQAASSTAAGAPAQNIAISAPAHVVHHIPPTRDEGQHRPIPNLPQR